jgi:tetratricopeptide (TPR) repeat protein
VNVDTWLGALRAAAASGQHVLALQSAESMHWFSDRWMHGPHWHEVFTLGAEAAAALGDLGAEAAQLNYLAWVHWVPPGDPEAVLRYAKQALDLATKSGTTVQVAWAHQYSALAWRMLGRLGDAAVSASGAAGMFKAIGDADAYFQALGTFGDCLHDQGRDAEALLQFRKLRTLVDDEGSGMTPSIAAMVRPYALIRLGHCLAGLGRRTEAITTLAEGIELMDKLQLSNIRQAAALEALGGLLAEQGRADESRQAYAHAARVYQGAGDTEATGRCDALAATAS